MRTQNTNTGPVKITNKPMTPDINAIASHNKNSHQVYQQQYGIIKRNQSFNKDERPSTAPSKESKEKTMIISNSNKRLPSPAIKSKHLN